MEFALYKSLLLLLLLLTITEWHPVDSHFVACSCIVNDGNFLGVLTTDCNIFDTEGALARLCSLQGAQKLATYCVSSRSGPFVNL